MAANFIDSWFWWILAGAGVAKVIAYFIAPQPPSTFDGHIGAILRGFIVFGVTLSVVSLIVCQFSKTKKRMFRIVFAMLFALACVLNVPSAFILRYNPSKAGNVGTKFANAMPVFEALMRYENNPLKHPLEERGIDMSQWDVVQTLDSRNSEQYPKKIYTDAQKYFNLSYCYATGFDGYPKDMQKAIQLCQKAASEPVTSYTKAVVERAQELLMKSGLPW